MKGDEGITKWRIKCQRALFSKLYLEEVQPNTEYFKIWVVCLYIIVFFIIFVYLKYFIAKYLTIERK